MHLADAWEHFGGYPFAESFGAFEFGGEDEGIEAELVDVSHHLISAGGRGVTFGYIPLVYMVCTAFRTNLYPKASAYILSANIGSPCSLLMVRKCEVRNKIEL